MKQTFQIEVDGAKKIRKSEIEEAITEHIAPWNIVVKEINQGRL